MVTFFLFNILVLYSVSQKCPKFDWL